MEAASRGERPVYTSRGSYPMMLRFDTPRPPPSETEPLQDLPHIRRDGDGLHGLRDRVIRVLQAVAGKGADDPLPLAEKRLLAHFYHAGNRCRRRGFAE